VTKEFETNVTNVLTALATSIAKLNGEIAAIKSTPAISTPATISKAQKQGKPDTGSAVSTCTVKVERSYQWVIFPTKPTREVLQAMKDWAEETRVAKGFYNTPKHPNSHVFMAGPEHINLVEKFASIGITATMVTVK
jgi:hypothetical protein